MIVALQPILTFLAKATGDEAKEKWPKGPTVGYRSQSKVPIADYVSWLRAVEGSSALSGQSARQLVQRIRRLYFSSFTVADKGETARKSDHIMTAVTPLEEPPLTTDHIPLAALNGLFATATIVAARANVEVDIGHWWIPADVALNGTSSGLHSMTTTAFIPLFTWAGDLGSAAREFLRDFKRLDAAGRTDAAGKESMLRHLNGLASREDLLGDFDGVIFSKWWPTRPSFVLSDEIERYFQRDDQAQAQAKAIIHPKSSRRFHWFVNLASDPEIPASGKVALPIDAPVDVTLNETAWTNTMKDLMIGAIADVSKRADFGVEGDLNRVGRRDYDKLCAKFAEFLKTGLANGIAEWPPTTW
jgi:hypothetical protein